MEDIGNRRGQRGKTKPTVAGLEFAIHLDQDTEHTRTDPGQVFAIDDHIRITEFRYALRNTSREFIDFRRAGQGFLEDIDARHTSISIDRQITTEFATIFSSCHR